MTDSYGEYGGYDGTQQGLPPDSGRSSGKPLPDSANKDLMRRYVREVIDAEAPQEGDRFFTRNFLNHDPAPGEKPGLEGVKEFIGSIFAAFSGFRTNVNEQVAEDDFVVGRWTQTFKQTGSYLGFPVTGAQILIGGITITRVRNGQILEEWEARDAAGLLQQLGVAPPLSLEGGDMALDGKDVVRRFFYECWSAHAPDQIDILLAPGFVNHILLQGQMPGREGVKQFVTRWGKAFPDGFVSVDLLIQEQDRVVARWTARGTHRDSFMGLPATGKPVEYTGISIFRVEGQRIVEQWSYWEMLTMMAQLGVLKFPGQGEAPGGGPGYGGQAPGSGGQVPGSGGQVPGSGGQASGSGGQAPGSGGQAPGSGGQAPGSGGGAPGYGGSAPGYGGGAFQPPGSDPAAESVARRWFDAMSRGDESTIDQLVSPSVTDHSGLSTAHGQGCYGHKLLLREFKRIMPDYQSRIEEITSRGNLVTIRHTGRGTPISFGVTGQAQPVEFEMVSTVRVVNGQIVEHWANKGPFGYKDSVNGQQSSEETKELVRRWFDAVNRGDERVLEQLVDYDVVDHSGLSTAHGHGCAGHCKLIRELRRSIPDWRSNIVDLTVNGDLVTIRHVGQGTPAAFQRLSAGAPSKVDFEMLSTVRVANGKIVEHWANRGPLGQKSGLRAS